MIPLTPSVQPSSQPSHHSVQPALNPEPTAAATLRSTAPLHLHSSTRQPPSQIPCTLAVVLVPHAHSPPCSQTPPLCSRLMACHTAQHINHSHSCSSRSNATSAFCYFFATVPSVQTRRDACTGPDAIQGNSCGRTSSSAQTSTAHTATVCSPENSSATTRNVWTKAARFVALSGPMWRAIREQMAHPCLPSSQALRALHSHASAHCRGWKRVPGERGGPMGSDSPHEVPHRSPLQGTSGQWNTQASFGCRHKDAGVHGTCWDAWCGGGWWGCQSEAFLCSPLLLCFSDSCSVPPAGWANTMGGTCCGGGRRMQSTL